MQVKNVEVVESELVKPTGGERKDFELFFKTRCGQCKAELGVFEFEEKVYHFMKAIP